MPEAKASEGNTKLGKGPTIGAFSLPPLSTCPGSTSWCRKFCYAKQHMFQYPNVRDRWQENEQAVRIGKLPRIDPKIRVFRIHVSGDFYSAPYIRAWIRLVRLHPDVRFWAYTHSWRVSRLLPALEALRAETNVQLFASVDGDCTEPTPAGWRLAYIEGDTDGIKGLSCPEQSGKQPSCLACTYCFKGQKGNVGFTKH